MLLWGLLAVAVIGGLISVTGVLRRPVTPAATPQPALPDRDGGAAGFASLFLQAWLPAGQGAERSLAPFMARVPDLAGVQPNRLVATGTTPVVIRPGGRPGYWSVTAAVTVAAVRDGGVLAPLGLRYYQVAVATCGTPGGTPPCPAGAASPGYTVVSAPAVVAGPGSAGAGELVTGQQLAAASPLGDTVSRFLAAYLAGTGELARYCAACSPLPAPVMGRVEVTELRVTASPDDLDLRRVPVPADETDVTVHVLARAVDTAGVTQTVAYPLRLTVRAGQWTVTAITDAPLLTDAPPSTSHTPLPSAPPSTASAAASSPAGAPPPTSLARAPSAASMPAPPPR